MSTWFPVSEVRAEHQRLLRLHGIWTLLAPITGGVALLALLRPVPGGLLLLLVALLGCYVELGARLAVQSELLRSSGLEPPRAVDVAGSLVLLGATVLGVLVSLGAS